MVISCNKIQVIVNGHKHKQNCGLVVSAPAWDGTGCEFDSWQCRIYIPCSLSLRLLGSLRGSLGTNGLTQKLCRKNKLKKLEKMDHIRKYITLQVLCLDGGGIRGLVLTQILLEIERILRDEFKSKLTIRECFDWIGGTSTGGILALAIARGRTTHW